MPKSRMKNPACFHQFRESLALSSWESLQKLGISSSYLYSLSVLDSVAVRCTQLGMPLRVSTSSPATPRHARGKSFPGGNPLQGMREKETGRHVAAAFRRATVASGKHTLKIGCRPRMRGCLYQSPARMRFSHTPFSVERNRHGEQTTGGLSRLQAFHPSVRQLLSHSVFGLRVYDGQQGKA